MLPAPVQFPLFRRAAQALAGVRASALATTLPFDRAPARAPWVHGLPVTSEAGSRGNAPPEAGVDPNEEDHYSLLGVPFMATKAEITRAYRRAMKRAHPDRHHLARRSAAEEHSRNLNAAYAVLSDPVKRLAYDRTIRQQAIQDQIMRRYVGGFQTFDNGHGPAREYQQREPTVAERKERIRADWQASLSLLIVAVAITVLIIALVVTGAFLGSVMDAAR